MVRSAYIIEYILLTSFFDSVGEYQISDSLTKIASQNLNSSIRTSQPQNSHNKYAQIQLLKNNPAYIHGLLAKYNLYGKGAEDLVKSLWQKNVVRNPEIDTLRSIFGKNPQQVQSALATLQNNVGKIGNIPTASQRIIDTLYTTLDVSEYNKNKALLNKTLKNIPEASRTEVIRNYVNNKFGPKAYQDLLGKNNIVQKRGKIFTVTSEAVADGVKQFESLPNNRSKFQFIRDIYRENPLLAEQIANQRMSPESFYSATRPVAQLEDIAMGVKGSLTSSQKAIINQITKANSGKEVAGVLKSIIDPVDRAFAEEWMLARNPEAAKAIINETNLAVKPQALNSAVSGVEDVAKTQAKMLSQKAEQATAKITQNITSAASSEADVKKASSLYKNITNLIKDAISKFPKNKVIQAIARFWDYVGQTWVGKALSTVKVGAKAFASFSLFGGVTVGTLALWAAWLFFFYLALREWLNAMQMDSLKADADEDTRQMIDAQTAGMMANVTGQLAGLIAVVPPPVEPGPARAVATIIDGTVQAVKLFTGTMFDTYNVDAGTMKSLVYQNPIDNNNTNAALNKIQSQINQDPNLAGVWQKLKSDIDSNKGAQNINLIITNIISKLQETHQLDAYQVDLLTKAGYYYAKGSNVAPGPEKQPTQQQDNTKISANSYFDLANKIKPNTIGSPNTYTGTAQQNEAIRAAITKKHIELGKLPAGQYYPDFITAYTKAFGKWDNNPRERINNLNKDITQFVVPAAAKTNMNTNSPARNVPMMNV